MDTSTENGPAAVELADAERSATFRDVFVVSEFRVLWVTQVVSLIGDQFARVALSVLVYERTGSALLTGAVYATSYLPTLLGGPLLSGFADRLPRRSLMIGCDVVRGLLIAALVIPGMPLWGMIGLLFVAEMFSPVFSAARGATVPLVLTGDRYVVGTAVFNLTWESAQIIGFAFGGFAVAVIGPQSALLLNAATFLLSAVFLWLGVRARPRPVDQTDAARPQGVAVVWHDLRRGLALVFGDPLLRVLFGLAMLSAIFVIPEALAVPVTADAHRGPVMVGLLLAANPVGAAIGGLVLARWVRPALRERWMVPMAVLTGIPLVACVFVDELTVVIGLWVLSGVFSAYNLPANAAFALAVPDSQRGQAFGIVQTGMTAGQGLGLLLGGAAAELLPPLVVVAIAGLVGCLLAASMLPARAGLARRSAGVPA